MFRKIVVNRLSSDFRAATSIIEAKLPVPKVALRDSVIKDLSQDDQVLVKNRFVGVNASDINYTAGKYLPGVKPPFDAGFEAVGEVVALGPKAERLNVGDYVCSSAYGAFAEYQVHPSKMLIKVPVLRPEVLSLLTSGLTASVSLEQVGQMKTGETVLVTAAAGGTGQFAVQLAKLAGNHVIGTCSSQDKVDFLRSIGCDRAIKYKEEDLFQVLKNEYPKGVDLVYEAVGGKTFDVCLNNIAVGGRIIIIGMVSGYQDQSAWTEGSGEGAQRERKQGGAPIPVKLLRKSASLRGFFLPHYAKHWKTHLGRLLDLWQKGDLKVTVDPTSFQGLEGISAAIEHMYNGKNIGKVVVDLGAHKEGKDTTSSHL